MKNNLYIAICFALCLGSALAKEQNPAPSPEAKNSTATAAAVTDKIAGKEPAPKSASKTETVKNTQEASPVLPENLDINWARTWVDSQNAQACDFGKSSIR